MGKIWTSVSLKPHQGNNWNLAHIKYSSWGTSDLFFMRSGVPSLWRHNCICRTPHPISMKIFDGHLGIKWSTEEKFITSLVMGFGSHVVLKNKNTFKNLLCSGLTERGETSLLWPPVHEEQKVHTYDIIGYMVGSHISLKAIKKKIHHSKEVLARVCNLWLLFFLFNFHWFFNIERWG